MGGKPLRVLLAIDPGRVSGWALFVDGVLREHGTAKDLDGRRVAMAAAIRAVFSMGGAGHIHVLAEEWSAGGWGSYKTLLGLGAQWGKWLALFEDHKIKKARIKRVPVDEWRKVIPFGAKRMNRDQWKAAARRTVQLEFGLDVSDDEAEAILIGWWECQRIAKTQSA